MSAAEKTRAKDIASEALEIAEAELEAAKAALANNPDDEQRLDLREKAQRSRDRAAMVLEAATTAHADAVAIEEAAARAEAEREQSRLMHEASLGEMRARAAPIIDELVEIERVAAEAVRRLLAIVADGDAKMRRATGNGNAHSPFTIEIARQLVLERIARARSPRTRVTDPNCADWLDASAWSRNRTHDSEQHEARGVARRLLVPNYSSGR